MSNYNQEVTVGIIAYNEHRYLPDLIEDLKKQTYPSELIEIVMVDGESSDDTWEIMTSFKENYVGNYKDIKVLKNPKRNQPSGWNVVIRNTTSEIMMRIDAHARLPEDFIEKNVKCINSGEKVCGGPRENIIDEKTPWKEMLLNAEKSMFGSGFASYRQDSSEKKYVKSVFHGAYTKEVIDKVGLFNENLIRTEDNEYHYRVGKAGYQICYDPSIKSYYQTRNSLKGMLKQKYQNGLWIGRTLYVCPGCVSLFHLVPFAFVIAIIITAILAFIGIGWPAIALWIAYGAFNLMITVMTLINVKKNKALCIMLPIVFLLLHLCYGAGTCIGLISRR